MEKEPVQIKEIGSYLEVDENGFIIKTVSAEKFQEKWKEVIDDIKETYLKNFGDKIYSIYIRGSVAKGEAIENISDVDSFAIVKNKEDELDKRLLTELEEKIEEKYSFVNGVELDTLSFERLNKMRWFRMVIKTQAVCIYGDDLAESMAPYKIGEELCGHVHVIEQEIQETIKGLKNLEQGAELKEKCEWIMKRILRSGLELVLERSHKYSRDLYPCYKIFSEYYPEKEKDMRKVLELAIQPTCNKEEIISVLNDFGSWIAEESKSYLA